MEMTNLSTHKAEVSGASPEWPTKSTVHEEIPIRDLPMLLLGEEGKRKLENRTKTNNQ